MTYLQIILHCLYGILPWRSRDKKNTRKKSKDNGCVKRYLLQEASMQELPRQDKTLGE